MNNNISRSCSDWAEKLVAFHSGDLSAEERATLSAHIQSCTTCQSLLLDYVQMDILVRRSLLVDRPLEITAWQAQLKPRRELNIEVSRSMIPVGQVNLEDSGILMMLREQVSSPALSATRYVPYDLGATLLVYLMSESPTAAVAWSPNEEYIASAIQGEAEIVRVWNIASGKATFAYFGHTACVRSVAWSRNRNYIASAGDDKTVQIWDATSGVRIFTYSGHATSVQAVVWSPDGNYIASADTDGDIHVWSQATGKDIYAHHDHSGGVGALAISPDSKYIVSGSRDATLRIWDVATGESVRACFGHTDEIRAVAFSPDGNLIASTSSDRTIRVWNTANGNDIYTYQESDDFVSSAAWSHRERRISSIEELTDTSDK